MTVNEHLTHFIAFLEGLMDHLKEESRLFLDPTSTPDVLDDTCKKKEALLDTYQAHMDTLPSSQEFKEADQPLKETFHITLEAVREQIYHNQRHLHARHQVTSDMIRMVHKAREEVATTGVASYDASGTQKVHGAPVLNTCS